jgi:hypothetical protein
MNLLMKTDANFIVMFHLPEYIDVGTKNINISSILYFKQVYH